MAKKLASSPRVAPAVPRARAPSSESIPDVSGADATRDR